ncbi:MAG: MbnH family di-heme enzyme [Myxococcota bacterium]
MNPKVLAPVLGWAFLGLVACDEALEASESESGHQVPLGFPGLRWPEDNPFSPDKAELGRRLFYDVQLSGNGTQSCASCHRQDLAFSDGRKLPVGSTGEKHPRNSPSLTNAGYNATLTWANPLLQSLEHQILIPMFSEEPVELGIVGASVEGVLNRLRKDPVYPDLFAAAFPERRAPIDYPQIVDALATFVRTLVSGNSPFDRFVYGENPAALSPSAQRGLELFFSERLECHHCHGGFNFSEASVHADSVFDAALFHNTGLYDIDGLGSYPAPNTGVHEVTGRPGDMGKFRAPTLRNVAVTGPYMHDGSVETLEAVIRIYEAGGRNVEQGRWAGDGRFNPLKSGFVPGFDLTAEERRDLLSFLESLTDESFLSNPRFSDPFESEP